MKIVLNGREQDIESGASVADLVALAGLGGNRVAIEVNQEIVPRSDYAARKLTADDRIEVVRAIGGG